MERNEKSVERNEKSVERNEKSVERNEKSVDGEKWSEAGWRNAAAWGFSAVVAKASDRRPKGKLRVYTFLFLLNTEIQKHKIQKHKIQKYKTQKYKINQPPFPFQLKIQAGPTCQIHTQKPITKVFLSD